MERYGSIQAKPRFGTHVNTIFCELFKNSLCNCFESLSLELSSKTAIIRLMNFGHDMNISGVYYKSEQTKE